MSEPQVCSVCVMDRSAPDISFDERGQCNFCRDFAARRAAQPDLAERTRALDALVGEIRSAGSTRRYDCIVGVSGGADSSYALVLTKRLGLRPLAVHLDNGWNSELATHNIANLVRALDVDLDTHVIDWRENRDLQRSFFAAHVIDIELLMDNAMFATLYRAARRHRVNYILTGSNSSTEGMAMPGGWNQYKFDARNIRAIHRRFGRLPIRTHWLYSTLDYVADTFVRKIRMIDLLDHVDYHKAEAVAELQREFGYKPYAHKHYESVFTRFYQGYILPRKFAVDKRRLHLSSLIVSGQMARDEALHILKGDPYPDPEQQREDRLFVLKKLGFSDAEFDRYIAAPPVPHSAYPSEARWMRRLVALKRRLGGRFYGRLRARTTAAAPEPFSA